MTTDPRADWPPASRNTDPATSHRAERQFTASGARLSIKDRVTALVRERPGLTRGEIADALDGLRQDQVWRRLPEAERDGVIVRGPAREYEGYAQHTWWPVEDAPDGAPAAAAPAPAAPPEGGEQGALL